MPSELQIDSRDDERLLSDEFLDRVIDWIGEFLGTPEPLPKGPYERGATQTILLLCLDPTKYQQVRQFILAHEVGHLAHQHTLKKASMRSKNKINAVLTSVVLSAVVASFLKRGSFSKGTIICSLPTTAFLTYQFSNQIFSALMYRAHEKEADLKALEAAEVEGAIFYFECMCTQQLLVRNHPHSLLDSIYLTMAIDYQGNNWSQTHPSHSARESYLKL